MYAGTASGAVTVGLAFILIMMSQKPNATESQEQPQPETPAVEKTVTAPYPPQTAVVLPPPPAAESPEMPTPAVPPIASPSSTEPAPLPIQRPALKPRPVTPTAKSVEVTPLEPRPQPAPPTASPPEPSPKQDQQSAPAPEPAPPEQVASLPDATQSPDSKPQSTPVTVTRKTVKEGRALLKMLEIGKGPVIEIAWPSKSADRSRLYHLLTTCHGMQTAMLVNNSRLYAVDTAPGQTWNVNRDAVSGFIRKPAGVLTEAERSIIRRIKSRHDIRTADTVRLFPRSIDAVMLGGLGQIVGPGYLKYKTIRARYQLSGDRITVVDVRVDGAERAGRIALPRSGRCTG